MEPRPRELFPVTEKQLKILFVLLVFLIVYAGFNPQIFNDEVETATSAVTVAVDEPIAVEVPATPDYSNLYEILPSETDPYILLLTSTSPEGCRITVRFKDDILVHTELGFGETGACNSNSSENPLRFNVPEWQGANSFMAEHLGHPGEEIVGAYLLIKLPENSSNEEAVEVDPWSSALQIDITDQILGYQPQATPTPVEN